MQVDIVKPFKLSWTLSLQREIYKAYEISSLTQSFSTVKDKRALHQLMDMIFHLLGNLSDQIS